MRNSESVRWAVLIGAVACCGCRRDPDRPPPVQRAAVQVQFPDGDPGVPADLGGPGFTPDEDSGWTMNSDFPPEGSNRAVKGGAVRYWMRFPPTLRTVGKDSGTAAGSSLDALCYESLLNRHSQTLEFVPRLASHWSVSEDRLTFRYRINPRAHWSDGRPVVADDVVATWRLLTDPTILQPAMQVVYGKFEPPVAVSQYIVQVRARSPGWRNFIWFSTMPVLPAHELDGLSGRDFLQRFQFRMITGSGPYELRESDVKKGQHVTLRRRADYWGWGERFAIGRFNFDLIRLVSTEDSVVALEKAKKGELDIYPVGKAKDWAVDLPRLDQVQRGLLLMTAVDNDLPKGVSGIVINMRKPPLDDVRVRRALGHLYNRQKLIDKLFFGQYSHLDSYFPGRYSFRYRPDGSSNIEPETKPETQETPDADGAPSRTSPARGLPDESLPAKATELVRYDPDKAWRLLNEAGWQQRDDDGVLVKDGRRLELELTYSSKVVERYLSIFQEDCLKAGVLIHLKQMTRASRFQSTYGNRSFQLSTEGWPAAADPNPETSWLMSLADSKNNNNLSGFKSARVDELCREYAEAFDPADRVRIIREIDRLIFAQHPCVLGWVSPHIRLIYWNRFGKPDWYIGRYDGPESVLQTWWVDEHRAQKLKAARHDGTRLDRAPLIVRGGDLES